MTLPVKGALEPTVKGRTFNRRPSVGNRNIRCQNSACGEIAAALPYNPCIIPQLLFGGNLVHTVYLRRYCGAFVTGFAGVIVVAIVIFILEYLRAVVQAVGGGFRVKVLPPYLTVAAVAQQVGNLAVFESGLVFVLYL